MRTSPFHLKYKSANTIIHILCEQAPFSLSINQTTQPYTIETRTLLLKYESDKTAIHYVNKPPSP